MRVTRRMKKVTVNNEERAMLSGARHRRERGPGKGSLEGVRGGMGPGGYPPAPPVGREERYSVLEGAALEMLKREHIVPAARCTSQSSPSLCLLTEVLTLLASLFISTPGTYLPLTLSPLPHPSCLAFKTHR